MRDDETTVSWMVIEAGWSVFASDGVEIGHIFKTVGDQNEDIFDGLAITHHGGPGLLHNYVDKPRYVPAEQVASIQPGIVRLSIDSDQGTRLPEHDVPESAEVLPDDASLTDRATTEIQDHTGADETR
jgi:hypothetical protein